MQSAPRAMEQKQSSQLDSFLSRTPVEEFVEGTQIQLFYNPKTKSMAPCMISNHRGKCQSFGIAPVVPQSYQKPKYKNPYYFSSPTSSSGLINQGLSMIGGGCTLGISC